MVFFVGLCIIDSKACTVNKKCEEKLFLLCVSTVCRNRKATFHENKQDSVCISRKVFGSLEKWMTTNQDVNLSEELK